MLCPYCLKSNLQNKLVLIGSECYVCENQWCNYVSEEYVNMSVDLDCSFDEIENESSDLHCSLRDINADVNQKEIINSNNHSLVVSQDAILNELHVCQEKETNYQNPRIKKSNTLSEKLSIVNWLPMPLIKVQSKILCFLLLHLDIFEVENDRLLNEIKKEYSIINRIASKFNMELVNAICYHFVSKLFELSQSMLSTDKIIKGSLPLDKRVLDCINTFLLKNDSENRLRCEFTNKIFCKKCQKKISNEKHSNYFISVPLDKSNFTINGNKISYKSECSKCFSRAQISTTITKIPKFLIVHCQNGCKERIDRFNVDLRIDEVKYPLLCVIESKYLYHPCNVIERNVDYQQFLSANSIPHQPIKSAVDYSIRYKSGDEWYSMSENGPKLCLPSDLTNVKNQSNLRLLIYGTIPTHAKTYDDNLLSPEDLLHNFELDNQINLSSFIVDTDKVIEKSKESVVKESSVTESLVPINTPFIRLEKLDLSCYDYIKERGVYLLNCPRRAVTVHCTSSPSFDFDDSIHQIALPNRKHDDNNESVRLEDSQKPVSASLFCGDTQGDFLSNNISPPPLTMFTDQSDKPVVKESNTTISNQSIESPVPIKTPLIHLDKLDLSCFDYNQENDVYLLNCPRRVETLRQSSPSFESDSSSCSNYSSTESTSSDSHSLHSQSTLLELDNDDDDDDYDYNINGSFYSNQYQKPTSISMYLGETLPYEPHNFLFNSSRVSSISSSIISTNRLNSNKITLNSLTTSSELSDSSFSDSSSMRSFDLFNKKRQTTFPYEPDRFLSSDVSLYSSINGNRATVNSVTTTSDLNDSFSDSSSMVKEKNKKNWNLVNRKQNEGETSFFCEPESVMFSSSGVSSSASSSVITTDNSQRHKATINSVTTSSDLSDSYSDSSSRRSLDFLTKKRKIGIEQLIEMKKARLV